MGDDLTVGLLVHELAATLGSTTGPPADRLYAVDPVGVATITPSAA